MKHSFFIILLFSMMSCSVTEERTVSEKSCKQTCLIKLKDYKSYDESTGCFCRNNE